MPRLTNRDKFLEACPQYRIFLPFFGGIAVGEYGFTFLQGLTWPLFGAALALGAGCFVVARRRKVMRFSAFLTAGCLLLGAALQVQTVEQTLSGVWEESPVRRTALIVSSPRPSPNTTRFEALTPDAGGTLRHVYLYMAGDNLPNVGQAVEITTLFRPPQGFASLEEQNFDYARYLRRQGISATAYVAENGWWKTSAESETLCYEEAGFWMRQRIRALKLRERLIYLYARYFSGSELALLSAMTLGERSAITSDMRALFSRTGTSHILALSGLHLAILFGFYRFFVLRRCIRRSSRVAGSLIGIAGVWTFAFIAGLPLSLVRAAVMFSLWQATSALQRESDSLSHLALAAFLIVLFSPNALFDVGFQLSFLAVTGIVTLSPLVPVKLGGNRSFLKKIMEMILGPLLISLYAQAATAPLVAYYFHTLPLCSLPANLIAVPSAYVLLFGSLLFFLLPFARAGIAAVCLFMMKMMQSGLEALGQLPGAVVALRPSWEATAMCYLLFGTLLWTATHPRRRALGILCSLTTLAATTLLW